MNNNELRAAIPGIGKTWDNTTQQYVVRIGVIDDPRALKIDHFSHKQARNPLSLSERDTIVGKEDRRPKDYPQNDNFTTLTDPNNQDFEPVNRFTRRVMVRWLDDIGGLRKDLNRQSYNTATGKQMKGFVNHEAAFVSLTSPGFFVGRRNDDGKGNGPYVHCGFEFMPPVGSKVLVGFRRGQEPYIISFLQDTGSFFTPRTAQVAKELGDENSILQNPFDVDVDGPKKAVPFSPTIDPLNMGAIRLSGYGGSYLKIDSDPDNFTKRSRAQKSDIELHHTLGSFIKIHSDPIPEKEDFPDISKEEAENVNEGHGTITVQHSSGSFMEIADGGSILLSDSQTLKQVDMFDWRPQDKLGNQEENEKEIKIGEHKPLEDIRLERLDPHGRGNFIFMDGRDKILIQDTALDFISLQNDNITLRNKSQTFLSVEGDKVVARNASGSQFLIDDKQISMKDSHGNHILLDGDTIQMGNKDGSTFRIGKDGITYSNATGGIISMNGDGIGLQTATGAVIEKLEDTINIVAKYINITAEEFNVTSKNTTMHSDKDTYIETGKDLKFKVANHEKHEIRKNFEIKSDVTHIRSKRLIKLRARMIREN